MLKVREAGDSFSSTQLVCEGPDVRMHLLCAAQPQEANFELLELKEDVVHGGVGVAGQQDTEAAGVQNPHLRGSTGMRRPVPVSVTHCEITFFSLCTTLNMFLYLFKPSFGQELCI